MASHATETLIGAIVLAAAGGFIVYAANTADVSLGGGGYPLQAQFRQADGLAIGSDVRLSGIKIGSITALGLDPDNYFATVTMAINDGIKLPEDSIAKIASEGLLGGGFVAVDPGASDFMLEPGAAFEHTQGSVNLIDLVSKAIHGGGIE
jgi:phospholipid/cholesterol/gamma-HCH transport system substrate-binding protein